MKKFFSRYNKPPHYRICKNRFGYFKVQQETWFTLFGRWGKFFVSWKDEPVQHEDVFRFKHRQIAVDYIKSKQEIRRRNNDDWGCGQIFK